MIYPTDSHSELNEHPTHIICRTETIHDRPEVVQVLDRTLDLSIQDAQVTLVSLHLYLRHVDNNHDSIPQQRSRSVILESHWGNQP